MWPILRLRKVFFALSSACIIASFLLPLFGRVEAFFGYHKLHIYRFTGLSLLIISVLYVLYHLNPTSVRKTHILVSLRYSGG